MTRFTRRRFLEYGAAGGAALALPLRVGTAFAQAPVLLNALAQPRFANPLPNALSPGFVFRHASVNADGSLHYEIEMVPFTQSVGLAGVGPAALWGYASPATGQGATYPGRTFVVQAGTPITVRFANALVDGWGLPIAQHLLPVDTSVHWAFSHMDMGIADIGVPLVTHLHGGHTESASDGLPEFWFTPGFAVTGPQWAKETYTYDNDQEAATIWYHDHALGITRLNVYAGLAGFYIVRDPYDTGLPDNPIGLPSGDQEVAFVIQDRMFTADGQLHYPSPPQTRTSPDPSVQPEFFGDVILVNGQAWPYLDVQPRKYRLRILNGSDSRFYALQLRSDGGGGPLTVWAIGTDGGLLAKPVELKGALVIAPGERMDVMVDFAEAGFGSTVTMTNNAVTPFPFGEPVVPPAEQIMRFNVGVPVPVGFVDLPLPTTLRSGGRYTVGGPVARRRQLLLFEGADPFGRIFALLGTAATGFAAWDDPVTETPGLNDVEEWEVINTTPDAHPIHVHLPQFEVLSRTPVKFTQDKKTGALRNITYGVPVPVPPWEQGPKDTAQMFSGEATLIRAKFDRPGEYVWHCHILSHEDHEMMRRYRIG
jgi:spore coat protein A